MEIKYVAKLKLLIVRMDGEIDDHIVRGIRDEIDTSLVRNGAKNIAFDFSGVNFMDSSGIGIIIGRYRKVNALGGQVILFGMNPDIKRLLEMANLKDIAIITDELEAAVEEVC